MSAPARIVISPHPLGSGFIVTSYAQMTSAIPAETIKQARTFARGLAATAGSGYCIIEETRLDYPLYVTEDESPFGDTRLKPGEIEPEYHPTKRGQRWGGRRNWGHKRRG